MKRIIFLFLLVTALLFVLGSCSIERKMAREFLQIKDSISILLLPPDFVFKSNLNTWRIASYDKISGELQQQARIDSSRVLLEIEDTLVLSRYLGALQAGLRKYGIHVYTSDQIAGFLDVGRHAYQVHLAQLEVEEGIYPFRAEEVFFDSILYYEDFDLDKISLNSWFEISKLNDTQAESNVVYATNFVSDELEGRFTSNVFNGEIKFIYNLTPLTIEDIYTLAATSGERYAAYIFDFVMNQYIYLNFPDDKKPDAYLNYDQQRKLLIPAADRRFLFLDE